MYSLTLIPPCRGLPPPRTPPWLFLPLVGRAKSLASPSALPLGLAPALTEAGTPGLRLPTWPVARRSWSSASSCRAFSVEKIYTPPP
jgi:hypothetical protein